MIYVIGGMKYSLNKTRAALNLAINLSSAKKRKVLLLDADPSCCASNFLGLNSQADLKGSLKMLRFVEDNLETRVKYLETKFDDIVIDSGVGETLVESLKVADSLIVPFRVKDLGLWTVWTLANFETLIENSLDENSHLKAYSLLVNPEKREKPLDLIEALEKSQYLKYLNSDEEIKDLFGNFAVGLESLKDMKNSATQKASEITD